VDIFGDESWDNKVAKWVYTGDDRNTVAVWVKGRLVHQREEIKSSKMCNGEKSS
jgi:guanine deaminase